MATKKKREMDLRPLCKYGANCYRTNPQHMQKFKHPTQQNKEEKKEENKPKKLKLEKKQSTTLDTFIDKKKETQDKDETKSEPSEDEGKQSKVLAEENKPCNSEDKMEIETNESDQDDEQRESQSPLDVKENIKNKFLVDMPEDFYDFWEFCQNENPENPCDALMSVLGFQLVGPFDILAGKHKRIKKISKGQKPNFLRHWRYYYDPPEFLTVIRGDNEKQLHLGYFRDDPYELPVFVASNCARENGVITPCGENLFAAVKQKADEAWKLSKAGKKLKHLSERLEKWAGNKNYSLEIRTQNMKARDKKVVCKSFHGAGVVVPVENDVGYRPVPEAPGVLKKIFRKIAESKNEKERDQNFEPLQELMTLIQFANDECDYGEGLELGLDLFTYGDKTFHNTILHLLPLAYELLNRKEFAIIIRAHLKSRKHTSDLSELV